MQTLRPFLIGEQGRERHQAEAHDQQRQNAAEDRRDSQIVEQLIEAEPQGGRGCEFRVPAADPSKGEEREGHDEHGERGQHMHADVGGRHA